jgi:hypothetical protein
MRTTEQGSHPASRSSIIFSLSAVAGDGALVLIIWHSALVGSNFSKPEYTVGVVVLARKTISPATNHKVKSKDDLSSYRSVCASSGGRVDQTKDYSMDYSILFIQGGTKTNDGTRIY